MSFSGTLQPGTSLRGSALVVEVIKTLELECFGNGLLVRSILLGLVLLTDGLVLRFGESGRDVAVGPKFTLLELQGFQ